MRSHSFGPRSTLFFKPDRNFRSRHIKGWNHLRAKAVASNRDLLHIPKESLEAKAVARAQGNPLAKSIGLQKLWSMGQRSNYVCVFRVVNATWDRRVAFTMAARIHYQPGKHVPRIMEHCNMTRRPTDKELSMDHLCSVRPALHCRWIERGNVH